MKLNKKLSDLFQVKEKEPHFLFEQMDKMGKLDDKKIREILLILIDEINELSKKLE